MLPKAVNHSHANERYIEEPHGTDMREAGIESLECLFQEAMPNTAWKIRKEEAKRSKASTTMTKVTTRRP